MLIFRNFIFNAKTVNSLVLRKRIKWRDISPSHTDYRICAKQLTTSAPNFKSRYPQSEWTDENFSERLKETVKRPTLLFKGLYNFAGEFHKLYEEKKEDFFLKSKFFECEDRHNLVDMLYTFDSEAQLSNFVVNTDSSEYGGYSSASLKITPAKTALFSGNICTERVKDGEAVFAGYATMVTLKSLKSFKRIKYHDWTYYTHIVFKVRGDGRTYFVHFSVPGDFEASQNWVYSYPLFTRGGPYWQVSKIALSDFYFLSSGNFPQYQPQNINLRKIAALGLTTRYIDGPFKLEIDYIGLECDESHRNICPYEQYA